MKTKNTFQMVDIIHPARLPLCRAQGELLDPEQALRSSVIITSRLDSRQYRVQLQAGGFDVVLTCGTVLQILEETDKGKAYILNLPKRLTQNIG